jgi:hypothetical protein
MLKILIEEIAKVLINALNGKARKIYTALSLLPYFEIFSLFYQISPYQTLSHSGCPTLIY